MATQIEYDSLKDMKLADYKKAFKEKSQWKKAKAVLFMIDYKLDGKKVPIAIPIKRPAELKALFKQAKGDKHPSKKLGGGFLRLEKNAEGIQFHVDLTIGGLSNEILGVKGGKLFEQLLKAQLIVNTGAELEEMDAEDEEETEERPETDATTDEEADLTDDTPDSEEDGSFEETEGNDDTSGETAPTPTSEKVDYKAILLTIKEGFMDVKETVVPNIKAKIYEAQMAEKVEKVIADVNRFQEAFELAPAPMQGKLQGHSDKVGEMGGLLSKYMAIIRQLEKEVAKVGAEAIKGEVKTKEEKAKAHLLEIQSLVNELKSALADH